MHETTLDITAETCPMTFVRTRLAIDRIQAGDVLAVRLRGEEPWRNVVGNCTALGHTILRDEPSEDEVRTVWIRKG